MASGAMKMGSVRTRESGEGEKLCGTLVAIFRRGELLLAFIYLIYICQLLSIRELYLELEVDGERRIRDCNFLSVADELVQFLVQVVSRLLLQTRRRLVIQ
jgi:hypothetical protein